MNSWQMKVLYDGACPICRREIAWLRKRDRVGAIVFEDISAEGFEPQRYGLTADEVDAEIHAVLPSGVVIRRMEVFRELYRILGLGWLIAPTGWPGLRWIFDRLYLLFARNRKALGRLFGGRNGCEL